jgi:hypothetical protein
MSTTTDPVPSTYVEDIADTGGGAAPPLVLTVEEQRATDEAAYNKKVEEAKAFITGLDAANDKLKIVLRGLLKTDDAYNGVRREMDRLTAKRKELVGGLLANAPGEPLDMREVSDSCVSRVLTTLKKSHIKFFRKYGRDGQPDPKVLIRDDDFNELLAMVEKFSKVLKVNKGTLAIPFARRGFYGTVVIHRSDTDITFELDSAMPPQPWIVSIVRHIGDYAFTASGRTDHDVEYAVMALVAYLNEQPRV